MLTFDYLPYRQFVVLLQPAWNRHRDSLQLDPWGSCLGLLWHARELDAVYALFWSTHPVSLGYVRHGSCAHTRWSAQHMEQGRQHQMGTGRTLHGVESDVRYDSWPIGMVFARRSWLDSPTPKDNLLGEECLLSCQYCGWSIAAVFRQSYRMEFEWLHWSVLTK